MRRNKWNNKIFYRDGKCFRSAKELKRYCELVILVNCEKVKRFECQVPYVVSNGYKPIKYYADFVVEWSDGHTTVEDVKGFKTELYKLKRSLMKEKYGIEIIEI